MPERIVRCPSCGRAVAWHADNPFRPFCSQRCKLIDLGEWASERYRLPAQETPPVSEPAANPEATPH